MKAMKSRMEVIEKIEDLQKEIDQLSAYDSSGNREVDQLVQDRMHALMVAINHLRWVLQ